MKNKKLVIKILIVLIVISIGIYMFMRNSCIKNVVYVPTKDGGEWGGGKVLEYYFIKSSVSPMGNFDKFKTRNEAISYCLNNKF